MKTKTAKQKPHYVDNKKFLEAMIEYRNKCIRAEEKNRKKPVVTNYIGECFLKIANHLSYRPNFINYTYRDDMISDGIENCLQYMSNFNPEKSNNPFAYFTQIIYYAFIRRIQKEKKQMQVKSKLIQNAGVENMMDQLAGDDKVYQSAMLDFLQRNSKEEEPKK
jgi:DNA-directed RNA polymerase specialized sigma subunit